MMFVLLIMVLFKSLINNEAGRALGRGYLVTDMCYHGAFGPNMATSGTKEKKNKVAIIAN